MQQIDNLNELPKEKRPPDYIIWDGSTEEMDDWLDRVLNHPGKNQNQVEFLIKDSDIEG